MDRFKYALIVVRTLAIALAGGLVAQLLNLPAAMLIGGALAVTASGFLKLKPILPIPLRNAAFVGIGLTLGTNVSRHSLALLPQWPYTLLGLFICLILIVTLCALVLHVFFRYDIATSILSSFPGHLSFVLSLAEMGYGNARLIAVIQSMRVLILTVSVPIVARIFAHAPAFPANTNQTMPWSLVVPLAAAAIAAGFLFRLLRIPAPFVLGPMVLAVTAKLMGLYDGVLPLPLTLAGFVVMGALIGSRFYGAEGSDLRRAIMGGIASTMVCIAVVSGAAILLTHITPMPFGQIWIGIAPGALESMGALGVALGFDAAFIAAHHTARFFMLTLGVPIVLRFLKRDPIP